MRRLLITFVLLLGALPASGASIFFLHHSTGRYLINEGDVRGLLAEHNERNGTAHEFWDHDYNRFGLRTPHGEEAKGYKIPDDNTDPDGLHKLWTTSNKARDKILASHDVIAFKSCYPASDVASDEQLETRKRWYLEMRDVFDRHPDKVFVVMSQPPRHRLKTNPEHAARARAFADWLKSDAFLAGHPNVLCFDFFDLLADDDDQDGRLNMLRATYEKSAKSKDSHPNTKANKAIAPVFLDILLEAVTLFEGADSSGN